MAGQCFKSAGHYDLHLAQVRERHALHIVRVHLNKDKCQISMAAGGPHVRLSTLLGPWLWGHQYCFQVTVTARRFEAIIDLLTERRETAFL